MDFLDRPDHLTEYLGSIAKNYLFTELDEAFLKVSDLEFLKGVDVPIKNEDLKDFTENGLSTTKLADNMAAVMGADIHFKYSESYLHYLKKLFDDKLILVFAAKAKTLFQQKEYREALCYLRAGMMVDENSKDALYAYAGGCRFWYLSMEGEDEETLISILKAEALEYFAKLSALYPDFAPSWYFLGYAYLNSGAYQKAQLSFKHYLLCCEAQDPDEVKEVKERLEGLDDPVRIEQARNLLISGKTEEALQILESYVDTDYGRWWPLHFYLAVGYEELGCTTEAIEGYQKVLSLNPSNYDAMIKLSGLYEEQGDTEKAEKYAKKAELVIS